MTRTVIDASPDANRHDTNRRDTTSETATGAASPIADSDPPGHRRRPAPRRLAEEAAPRRPGDAGGEVRTRFLPWAARGLARRRGWRPPYGALRARTAASLAALTGAMERSSAATAFGFRRRAPPIRLRPDDDPGAAAGAEVEASNNPTPLSIHRDRSNAAPRSIASIASIASRVAEPATSRRPGSVVPPVDARGARDDAPLDAPSPSLRTPRVVITDASAAAFGSSRAETPARLRLRLPRA